MFALTRFNIDTVFIGLYVFISSLMTYLISAELTAFNQTENLLLITITNFLMVLTPISIFTFYVLTSYFMFNIFDVKMKLLKLTKIIAISYTPILWLYFLIYFLLQDANHSYTTLNFDEIAYFGYSLNTIFEKLQLIWIVFYFIFTFLIQKNTTLNLPKSIIVVFTPTILILIFKVCLA